MTWVAPDPWRPMSANARRPRRAPDDAFQGKVAAEAPRPVASLYGPQSAIRPGEATGFRASLAADTAKRTARREAARQVLEAQGRRSARRAA